jgi:hypothetical protein
MSTASFARRTLFFDQSSLSRRPNGSVESRFERNQETGSNSVHPGYPLRRPRVTPRFLPLLLHLLHQGVEGGSPIRAASMHHRRSKPCPASVARDVGLGQELRHLLEPLLRVSHGDPLATRLVRYLSDREFGSKQRESLDGRNVLQVKDRLFSSWTGPPLLRRTRGMRCENGQLPAPPAPSSSIRRSSSASGHTSLVNRTKYRADSSSNRARAASPYAFQSQ